MNYKSYLTRTSSFLPMIAAWPIGLILSCPAAHAQYPDFKAEVIKNVDVAGLSSASGIVELRDSFYIIGDDSPYMIEMDRELTISRTLEIYPTKDAENGRIPAKVKPDFESMVVVPWGKDKDILVFGSGSGNKERDILVRIDLDSADLKTKSYDLKKFYAALADKSNEKGSLNIEGAARWGKKLILLNRADNTLFLIDLKDFRDYVKGKEKDLPEIEAIPYELPVINGITARFSGACILKDEDMLVFTASLENTPNWAVDGEILGSYIGLIDLNQTGNRVPVCEQIMEDGKPYLNKVESIMIREKDENNLHMYGVTDNDDGASDLVDLLFRTIRKME
ncbi:MAG: hypothetical protein JW801_06270 [Bacteroidales bacterium]|nr:hypothetical protein [Bacteroidales bacterium]